MQRSSGPSDRRRLPLLEDEDLSGEAVMEPSRLIRPVDAPAVAGALQARLTTVAQKLRADFTATAHTRHPGSRGTEREEVVARYLRPYLPLSVEILHNAEIITAAGKSSPQCDLVIVDRSTPS